MGGMEIARSKIFDVLGTSSDLRWDDAICNVSKEAAKSLDFLSRSSHYLRHLYQAEMEYNSHLWAGASNSALDFVDRINMNLMSVVKSNAAI